MKLKDWVAGLKHLAMERVTYYDNSFPSNCGEINPDGSISFDCIGLVKSVINEPDICYKTSPAWYYVTPDQVIPDTTEIGILNLCSNVHWGDFSNCITGSYVYMDGHAGVFVSDFTDTRYNNTVNTIECTPAMDGGVTTSYTDIYGNRFNHKGGNCIGRWEAWGVLPYIDYSQDPEPKPEPKPEPAEWKDITVDNIVDRIIDNEFDAGDARKEKLYRYFQDKVNDAVKRGYVGVSYKVYDNVEKIVQGIIYGDFGSGDERVEKIYRFFQDKVNQRFK